MELRQLRYFIAVAEEMHFGRAAERLHMAQPPLSQQIKKLEEDLGVRLLDRNRRRVELTREGIQFLSVARNTLEVLETGADQVRRISRGEIGKLRIGFISSAAQSQFPEAVAEFRKQHPGIVLDIKDVHSQDVIDAVRDGHLDAGVIQSRAEEGYNSLEWLSFLLEPYMLAVREDHALACNGRVDVRALDRQPLIMLPREHYPATWETLTSLFDSANIRPRIVQEVDPHLTRLALVAAGMGVSFVPARMERVCPPSVRLVSMHWKERRPMSELRLIWRRNDKAAGLDMFIKVMQRFCHQA